MKVTLHTNHSGQLMIYVPKKDLEEEVVEQTWNNEDTCTFTLTNGWQLQIPGLTNPISTPKTVRATRLN